jgi:hypothetical protein
MDTRSTDDTRKDLKAQTVEEVMKCIKPQVVKFDIDGCKLHFLTVLGSPHDFDLTDYFIGLTVLPVIVWNFRPVSRGIQLLRAYPLRRVSHIGA